MFAAVRFVRDHLPESIDATAHHVAMVLASFTDVAGETSVGVRTIARSAHMNAATVCRAIARLEEAGVVRVERTPDRRSAYRFPVATPLSTTARSGSTVALSTPARSGAGTARSGATNRAPWARALENEGTEEGAPDSRDVFVPGAGWVRQRRHG